jgi:hypothetical protein
MAWNRSGDGSLFFLFLSFFSFWLRVVMGKRHILRVIIWPLVGDVDIHSAGASFLFFFGFGLDTA